MFGINGAFPHNPVPLVVAGNLWTITFEFWCYIALATGVAIIKALRFIKPSPLNLSKILVFLILIVHGFGIYLNFNVDSRVLQRFVYFLLPLFLFGGLCGLNFDKIDGVKRKAKYFVISALLVAISYAFQVQIYHQVGSYLIGILVLVISSLKRISSLKILSYFNTHDVAYGTYLYSLPFQQLLLMLGLKSILGIFFIATPVSLLIGHVSYVKIESRWLRKK
jgi:hypothetical protein